MTEPAHPVLDYLDAYIRDMSWRDVLTVRRTLNDYLAHEANERQIEEAQQFATRFATPTEGATA